MSDETFRTAVTLLTNLVILAYKLEGKGDYIDATTVRDAGMIIESILVGPKAKGVAHGN